MAIVQISRITQRKGLSDNLPQLAGAEFGWVIDQRRLFIGNGTLADGAPAVGNTEVLTEYSDILDLANQYTYKGEAAGYTVQTGPTTSDPVTRSLQSVLDDYACVKDFGATGDGTTDDTEAINRALFQLYCREVNPQIRRSLFFPAGTYRVSDSIKIPPYATLIGEGADHSIILLDSAASGDYVAQTADSLQQTGVSIGNNDAITPQRVEIYSMSFQTEKVTDVFLVEAVDQMFIQSVNFVGPLTQGDLTTAGDDIAGVRFASTGSLICNQVTFDSCRYTGLTFGAYINDSVEGITFSNGKFVTLYQGVVLNSNAVGVRIVQNLFDLIAYDGIIFGSVSNNISGYNIFLDVGNEFGGSPASPVIDIQNNNNVSVGDMFERNVDDHNAYPRINIDNDVQAFALDNGERYLFGSYRRESGRKLYLNTAASETEIFSLSADEVAGSFIMEYRYQDALGLAIRYGRMTVVGTQGSGILAYNDDYVENGTTGITLTAEQISTTIYVNYTAPASEGYFTWSLSHF